MKIENASNALLTTALNENKPAPQKNNAAMPSTKTESTSVSLGQTATRLRSMEENLGSAPAVDLTKVAEIKQAISEGRFKINSEVIADRLINTVRDLISNKG